MTYYCINFKSFDNEWNIHRNEINYFDLDNAIHMALSISTCVDVNGCVDVIDCMTGEVMFTAEQGKEIYRAN